MRPGLFSKHLYVTFAWPRFETCTYHGDIFIWLIEALGFSLYTVCSLIPQPLFFGFIPHTLFQTSETTEACSDLCLLAVSVMKHCSQYFGHVKCNENSANQTACLSALCQWMGAIHKICFDDSTWIFDTGGLSEDYMILSQTIQTSCL